MTADKTGKKVGGSQNSTEAHTYNTSNMSRSLTVVKRVSNFLHTKAEPKHHSPLLLGIVGEFNKF